MAVEDNKKQQKSAYWTGWLVSKQYVIQQAQQAAFWTYMCLVLL